MAEIHPVSTFRELAASRKQNYTRVSIQDKTVANVLYDKGTFSVYYMDKDSRAVCGTITHGTPDVIRKTVMDFMAKFKDFKVPVEGLEELLKWCAKL